jgi:8-oxo-dGTP pyrophosphatase MutT (NUDIX family)
LFCRDAVVPNDLSKARLLLGQRRDSISYWEFVKNNVPKGSASMFKMHVRLMSDQERQRCIAHHLANDFDTLWDDLWVFEENGSWTTQREKCRVAFHANMEQFMDTFEECQRHRVDVSWTAGSESSWSLSPSSSSESSCTSLLDPECDDVQHETMWHFPKGRLESHESQLQCALREFEEETGISKHQVRVLDRHKTMHELYVGTNGKLYRTVYYLSEATTLLPTPPMKRSLRSKLRPFYLSDELNSLRWCSFDEAQYLVYSTTQPRSCREARLSLIDKARLIIGRSYMLPEGEGEGEVLTRQPTGSGSSDWHSGKLVGGSNTTRLYRPARSGPSLPMDLGEIKRWPTSSSCPPLRSFFNSSSSSSSSRRNRDTTSPLHHDPDADHTSDRHLGEPRPPRIQLSQAPL